MENKNSHRREFIKKATLAGMSAFAISNISASEIEGKYEYQDSGLLVPKQQGLKITGTFLDEISHDIPHQNWGEREWELDFQHMKAIGIDTVIMIRSGYRKFITYPSKYLLSKGCYMPSIDLLDLFLRLA